jgi:predicted GTPase
MIGRCEPTPGLQERGRKKSEANMKRRVVILGAAGRDFHNFNVRFRNRSDYHVVAFTATQIPDIAGRIYPPELAGSLYPRGIPIVPEEKLDEVLETEPVHLVVFSYSDVSHTHVMHLASRAVAHGADFLLLGAETTMLKSVLPVISVCAVRTGCGKSPVSRRLVQILRQMGQRVVVVRHPMPYGDLSRQRLQRFATLHDLETYHCTVEEREEYEPHLVRGTVVYAGVDYELILAQAEREADVIVWDGGNNDTPFLHPDLEIVVTDPHRAGHELLYYPGEVNLRRAHVVVINKVDTADPAALDTVRRNVARLTPRARVIETASVVLVDHPEWIRGKRVLVVEDGPTLTHGGMSYGAGTVAARQHGAAELVEPWPYAVGSLRDVFAHHPHISRLLPAMGYSPHQLDELEATIRAAPWDSLIVATPVDLARLIRLDKPAVRVRYEVVERRGPMLVEVLQAFLSRYAPVHA